MAKTDSFTIEIKDKRVERENVRKKLRKILKYLDEDGSFSISFVSDDEIRMLNSEYRGIDDPTDILTFALSDGEAFPTAERELGDIFISVDSMLRNAEEFGVDPDEEFSRLLVHGILHLRGMDHKTNDFSTEPMLIEQEMILSSLGFAISKPRE